MRILWITWGPFEPFRRFIIKGRPEKSSSWTSPLFFTLSKDENIELGSIVPVINGVYQKKDIDNIIYYSIPIKAGANYNFLSKELIKEYQRVIDEFKPDLIHVHGVEVNFGLLREYIDPDIPIVCSIQGIINPYYDFLEYSVATLH